MITTASAAVREPASNAGARYLSVDALRGLIMILMAIDHASAFIARQHASEFWAGAMSAYTAAFPFLTRLVTHLCAPGFFFLMGAGIYWLSAAQIDKGSSKSAVGRHTVKRGLAFLILAQFFEGPMLFMQGLLKPAAVSLNRISAPPPNDGTSLYWGLITLTGLALVMIACGFLLRLRPWAWLVLAALCVFATNSLLPASGKPGSWWMAVLLAPGIAQHLLVIYPAIPWLAAAAAGMYFGYWWRGNPSRAERRVWIVGAVLLAVSIALRATGGWGNIRLPRDNGWIEFLNNVKYPPSFVFLTMSLGINLLLLALFTRLNIKSDKSPLIVFGQTPLFFYIAHFYLLLIGAFVFYREPSSLEGSYRAWAIILILLYPLCTRYRRFKMTKPRDSFWRFF